MEHHELCTQVSPLGKFEFEDLDNDDGTNKLFKWLRVGWHVWHEDDLEVHEKYKEVFESAKEERDTKLRYYKGQTSQQRKKEHEAWIFQGADEGRAKTNCGAESGRLWHI